ncbi:DinB family protein [Paracrocinitomix mangrovi]|uniref:DinB family protein n=1 Tax=Paracrocinitomix mangrovi TaxID=2862509 RepID=UPI001C8D5C46|nr:DinB family protein [Paracrocinitomix mangrovi]UKN01841.1 DinB family protein [Paracrocinitomix mangrovi]
MKFESKVLISELEQMTQNHLAKLKEWKNLDFDELNYKPTQDSWSALECVEHLNRYAEFYMPEIGNRIKESQTQPNSYFSSGVLGNYFAKSMEPKPKLNKMKTFKSMNPNNSDLDLAVLDKLIKFEETLLQHLNVAKTVDLKKVKTSITISKLIKLRLGDTFRFYINHIERHFLQAERAMAHATTQTSINMA